MTIEHTGNVKMTPEQVVDAYEKYFERTGIVYSDGVKRTCIAADEYNLAMTLPVPQFEEDPIFWEQVQKELERRGYWGEDDNSSKIFLCKRRM